MTRQGGAGAAACSTRRAAPGDSEVLGVFTASGTVDMSTGRIPFAPEAFPPILQIRIDPFLVAVRDTSPSRTPGDPFEVAHARPGEVSVSVFSPSTHPHNRDRYK